MGRQRPDGHDYITLVADAEARPAVVFFTEGRDAATIEARATDFRAYGGDPLTIELVSIDMSPAFIKGVTANLPNVTQVATKRTARAWLYKEQLRETLDRKQVNVVRALSPDPLDLQKSHT